ncbi:MAG: FAD-dependent oxidoreductase, partial [Planctomycetes bacterium]|nr:FAD-dependent oxidoreductase [Planctomycetota bacterium]
FISQPTLVRDVPLAATLADLLRRSFSDDRMAQLFGRYATYVGGSPYHAPALLSLIWQAEAGGVWSIDGGLHRLAKALMEIAQNKGAEFHFITRVARIETSQSKTTGVVLSNGDLISADTVLFNGDPRALATGALGPGCDDVAKQTRKTARSLSAEVWSFAARVTGPELAHHNVFFRDDPKHEFDALDRGIYCNNPTLYVCAADRADGDRPVGPERFEIIANAPPTDRNADNREFLECMNRTFRTLATFGLNFDPVPGPESLTTPRDFATLFPHSNGSLYGQSPHGLLAAFQRPTAVTRVKGLFLAGGGTHPGAGLPMAALSGKHAAEAILRHRTSTLPSLRTATPGGMSTASATTAPAPSASSRS